MESCVGQGQSFHTHDGGANRRGSENEDKEGERDDPSYTGRRYREGLGGDRELRMGGGRHRSPPVDRRSNEKQERVGIMGNLSDDSQNAGPSRHNEKQDRDGLERARLETLARRDSLHEARAFADGQPLQREGRHGVDDASAAHRQVSLGAHSQQKQSNVRDSSIDRFQRSPDDSYKEYKQRRSGGDDDMSDVRGIHDVASNDRRRRHDASDDHYRRREQDVDTSSGDRSRMRRDVNDGRRRRDDDDNVRRNRDADDTRDNYSRHNFARDKSNKSQGVDDVRGHGQRRRNGDDVPGGDSHRTRHDADGVADRRWQDMDDAFENRRASGGRDHQSRSPYRSRSHHDKRHTQDDGGRDRFSARFKDAERNEDELPELFSVHRAKVQSVRPFGVFVRLEGFYKQGLVHLSQLSDHEVTEREDSDEMKVRAVAAVAGEGDQVWVKVISLKDDGGNVKIGCSLKLVSQSTGKDLDPNNLKLEQQQPKGNRPDPKKVTLDAIYNVVCSRCGGHGHLKTECYGTADKSYELLPEEDDDPTEQFPQPLQSEMPVGEVGLKPGYGRGRAMVLPAWMTHGTGANASQLPLGSSTSDRKKKKRKASELPDKITTVEEAMALISQVKKAKKDKHHRKEHRKHKKDRKLKKSSKKESSSRKDRARD